MKYIEDNYVKKMFSNSLLLSKQIYDFCKQDENLHDPYIRTLSYYYLWMNEDKSPSEVTRVMALAKKHPDKERGEFLAKAIQRQITNEEIAFANNEIILAIQNVEQLLQMSQSEFLMCNEYTMADAVAAVRLHRFQLLNFGDIIKKYPLTLAYYERMVQRSSFSISF